MKNGGTHRLQWPDIPVEVCRRIARALGSPVIDAAGQSGGYGPGLVARCVLANGRRVFIKAVSPSQNPDSVLMMRREAEVTQSLPDDAPAPALLHVLDDGFWVVLVFEDIEGALPTIPWDAQQLARVVEAMNHLSRLPTWSALPTVVERYGEMLSGWRILAAAGPAAVNEPWCRDHLEELAALEAQWEDAAAGDHLVHGDVRSDNVLFSNDGRVVFVDWSTSCIGAPWFDLVASAPKRASPSIGFAACGQPPLIDAPRREPRRHQLERPVQLIRSSSATSRRIASSPGRPYHQEWRMRPGSGIDSSTFIGNGEPSAPSSNVPGSVSRRMATDAAWSWPITITVPPS
jgi:serine/threonine protein kinase